MRKKSTNYNVVFEYTQKTGLYAGGRFWTSYPSEDDFKNNHLPGILAKGRLKVVVEGVTDEDAERIHGQMSKATLVSTALDEAILHNSPLVNGKPQLSLTVFRMSMLNRGLQVGQKEIEALRDAFYLLE